MSMIIDIQHKRIEKRESEIADALFIADLIKTDERYKTYSLSDFKMSFNLDTTNEFVNVLKKRRVIEDSENGLRFVKEREKEFGYTVEKETYSFCVFNKTGAKIFLEMMLSAGYEVCQKTLKSAKYLDKNRHLVHQNRY